MGQLDADLKAALARGVREWLFEIDFPGATWRASRGGYSALGVGYYPDRLLSCGPLNVATGDRSGTLPALEVTMEFADEDGALAQIIEGPDANEIRGSAVRIYLASPDVDRSKWSTRFTGIIAKPSESPRPRVVRITARVDDTAFTREIMRRWTITKAAWPNAAAASIGQIAALVYGQHSCANYRPGPGMLPAIFVDTVNFRYTFAAHKVKALDVVYVDGVATGSGWSLEYVTASGVTWACVKFTADQGDAVITVDAKGVEDVGDGSGTLITSKADQLAHLLSNFVFDQWSGAGAWLSTHARVDGSLTGAINTFLSARGSEGRLVVSEPKTPAAIVAELCDQESLYGRWTETGAIAFGMDNVFALPYAAETLDWYSQELDPLATGNEDVEVTSECTVNHVPSTSDGKYLSTFVVADPGAVEYSPTSIDLSTSAAR